MINLGHINGLVDHEDQVIPCITACILDGSIHNLCLARWLQGIKTTVHNYIEMLMYHYGILAYDTVVSLRV